MQTTAHPGQELGQDLGDDLLVRIAERLKAMADPTRLRLLHQLEQGEICVGDLAVQVGGSQANVSKHLAVLRKAGLVRCRRDGMNVCYAIADRSAFDVCRTVCDALAAQADRAAVELRRGAAALVHTTDHDIRRAVAGAAEEEA
jgi:DNA-binding transcriptional ArsR family regulator